MDEHRDAPPLQLGSDAPTSRQEPALGAAQDSKLSVPWLSSTVVAFASIMLALGTSLMALIVAMLINLSPDEMRDPDQVQQWMEQFITSPQSFAIMVIPGQLTFLMLAIGGGLFSRERFPDRLGMRRGPLPLWTWGPLAFATPFIGFVTGWLIELGRWEPSEHLLELDRIIGDLRDEKLVFVMALVALLPGICEELLFRGYVQSRLVRVWPATLGILFSSAWFAAAHLDPMHAIAVFPLGLWLGIIAWRCQSVWPAMLGHIVNNGSSVLMATSEGYPEGIPASRYIIPVAGGCLLASLILMWAFPGPKATGDEKFMPHKKDY